MIITGQFRDINEDLVSVEINNTDLSGETIEIGKNYNVTDDDLLYFDDEPVTTSVELDDLFQVVIKGSASISLQARDYIGDKAYGNNARSITIKIYKGNRILFDGYAEPGVYNQPYTMPYDEFTINCIDKLSTLQYYKYKDITPNTYANVKQEASTITFREIIDMALEDVIGDGKLYYDLSKGISGSQVSRQTVFDDIAVSEDIFLGEEYDDTMNYEQVLTEVLKYLNLHIMQVGKDFFIFDWDSIKNNNTIWYNLTDEETETIAANTIVLNAENNGGDNTNVSIADVYNQILLTCETNKQDTLVEDPLDDESLYSPYANRQLYCREYISEGEGHDAFYGFYNMLINHSTNYDACKTVDWYIQALESRNWKLYSASGDTKNLHEQDSNGTFINQWKMCDRLHYNPIEPLLVSMGKVEHQGGRITDDSPVTKIPMNNYLYLSVNGNESDDDSTVYPNSTIIDNRQPVAEFISPQSGGIYSPVDEDTTNYLVFSGKLLFLPKERITAPYSVILMNPETFDNPGATVPSDNTSDGRFYTRRWFHYTYPNDRRFESSDEGLVPVINDKVYRQYEYNYSEPWNDNDTISNLDVLECELIIGNKRLIQYYSGDTAVLQWVELGNEPLLTFTEDGRQYQVKTFQLGVNPKIGDFILGDEFDIRSNMPFSANIDTDGFCVPIKKSDALSGKIVFRILGPVNTKWNEVTRRHPSFWRSTSYSDGWHYILSHTENIVIKNFKCELKSDNAGVNANFTADNKDLIYMSNMTDSFVNNKDDISFKIITQLGTKESIELGVDPAQNINAAINTTTSMPLETIHNFLTNEDDRAEKHYVDEYYRQYSTPRLILDRQYIETSPASPLTTYSYPQLNRNFLPMSLTRNVKMNITGLSLLEI